MPRFALVVVAALASALATSCGPAARHPAKAPAVTPAPVIASAAVASDPTTPAPSSSVVSTPVPGTSSATAHSTLVMQKVTGDVDGDGRADVVELIESTDGPHAADRRFGVRARMTAYGTQTVWWGYGEGSNDGQQLFPLVDIGRDDRREVVLQIGSTASAGLYALIALAGRRFVRVTGADLTHGQAGQLAEQLTSWGCRGTLLYAATAESTDGGATYRGTRTNYRLSGGHLVEQDTVPLSWRGATAPAEFRGHQEAC